MRILTYLIYGLLFVMWTACTTSPPVVPTQTVTTKETAAAIVTASPSCETHTASITLSSSDTKLSVGESFKVVVTLNNQGCVALGVPQYTLYVSSRGVEPAIVPANPEPIEHYLAIDPGQSDSAEFSLQAVSAGWVEFTASTSFEVHLGYPGPAYWGTSESQAPLRLLITSIPAETPTRNARATSASN